MKIKFNFFTLTKTFLIKITMLNFTRNFFRKKNHCKINYKQTSSVQELWTQNHQFNIDFWQPYYKKYYLIILSKKF